MKRIPITVFMFALAIGGFFAYGMSLGYDFSSVIEWAKSFARRAVMLSEGLVNQDARTKAASLIAGFEGFSPKAYPDPRGQNVTFSIGYGHQIVNGDGYTLDSVITEEEGFSQLVDDIETYAECVEGSTQQTLSANQEAALISLCYNIGCGAYRKSTVLRLLNAGNFQGASDAFAMWNKAGGEVNDALVSRRQDESDLFNS